MASPCVKICIEKYVKYTFSQMNCQVMIATRGHPYRHRDNGTVLFRQKGYAQINKCRPAVAGRFLYVFAK